jgi:hypothetical protein
MTGVAARAAGQGGGRVIGMAARAPVRQAVVA